MVIKTVAMLLMYLIPSILLCFGLIPSPLIAMLLYVLGGLGIAGIGMGIMHDANHGSYTKDSKVAYLLGHTLDLMGCSSEMWKLQHNVLHHTYTNVHGHDEDISAPLFLLRFSPHSKRYPIHKFQYLYVWFFYSILTLYWVTVKDFRKAGDYLNKGLILSKGEYRKRLVKLSFLKLGYFTYALVLPMIFAPFSIWWILLGFVVMHLIAGLLLSVVFQLAHVVPDMDFPQPDEEDYIDSNWNIHQLQTTSNFSTNNPLLIWYFGGLTHQIEHHLFPNICHVHYKRIGKIVERTAKDFNLPYNVNNTFYTAVSGHVKILRQLGTMNTI